MQGTPRGDRDWEHWPGRTPPDDGIRHRLRGLFTASGEDEIEMHLAERGREIEQRTEQLHGTISDLEQREEQTAKLRSTVEEMLRLGSAELDERHAALAGLATELGAREEKVRAAEGDLAIRTQELGAVELRRAAVERREEAAEAREKSLARQPSGRGLSLAQGEHEVGTQSADVPQTDHLLLGPGNGYWITEGDGPAPAVGATVDIDNRTYVVTRVGRSPLPDDRRSCAYLEPATSARAAL